MEACQPLKEILFTEEQIRERIRQLGAAITRDYAGKGLVLLAILRGGAIFAADLAREIRLPLEMDFMAASSYGNGTHSSGCVRLYQDQRSTIEGRHVIVVEDVLDSGLTLRHVLELLSSRGPASLQVAALLRKDTPDQVDVDCAYVGFECPQAFVVGYGLDHAERYRNLPYIGVLDETAAQDPAR